MKTGELAARAGVNVQTLRYYERRGLLKEPGRRPSGYREYPADAVSVIRFIKRAQELGFTLAEVEEVLLLQERDAPCAEVRAIAEAKMLDVQSKIRHLRAMKRSLAALVRACVTRRSLRGCSIIEALSDRREESS
ncbi:MAG: MerR family transcriptional regulator [Planctomycetes bacterium]|nr:MerR family transcriptional regulator [Nannocystis sp.]MBA3845020.1 MerR family transcriptional regulator [Planctomycetota bacterium]